MSLIQRKLVLEGFVCRQLADAGSDQVPAVAPAALTDDRTHAEHAENTKFRDTLKQWIEATAKTKKPAEYTKRNFLGDAREKVNKNITKNMFNDVWRSATVPDEFKKRGRRKTRFN